MKMKKNLLFIVFALSTYIGIAQTITGTVIDTASQPIENALVCLKNTPTTYTKTDENGNFSINASVGDQLRIGALHYETQASFTTTVASGQQIMMQDDPLLSTDVFHISFDHMRAGNTYTKNEMKDDFNLAYTKGFYDGSAGSDRAAIDYNVSRDPGGASIKVKFPQGALKTADSGVDTRIDLEGVFNNNTFQSEDLYLSYWVKFGPNYEWDKCGGKLPSLGGSDYNSSQNRWKGRIMWRKGGSIQFYMELPDNGFTPTDEERFWGPQVTPGSGICEFEYMPYLGDEEWHNIELHYKFETPGQNDGYFEGWVDGVNYDFMDATVFNNYRPAGTTRENITINTILLSAFLGGSDITDYAPTQDIYAWFDEFRVSTQRVDEWSDYSGTLSNIDFSEKQAVKVFPNPSIDGVFNLQEDYDWIVYDVLGKQVAKGNSDKIDISHSKRGMYFAKIENTTVKLIVQ